MPGNRYVQVLNTCLNRRLLIAAMLGTTFICLIPIVPWWVVDTAQVDKPHSLFGLLFAFPAMFIGAHVKQQLATHEASLVPGYRRPHLVVAALMFLTPILFAVLAAPTANNSIVGHVALVLLVCLACFNFTANPSDLGALVLAAVCLPIFAHQMGIAIAMEQILAGSLPGLAWCLLSAEAALGILLFHHLANLTEDDPSYGSVMPMNAWDMRAAEVRRRNRAQLQRSPKVLLSIIEGESRRLDRMTAEPAKTRRQRVSLLQMSGDWPVNLSWVLLIMTVMGGLPLLIPRILNNSHLITTAEGFARALAWPMMLSLGMAWVLWLPPSQRWSRLGYESLRPSTREDWVLENGLAIIRRTLTIQLGWVLVQVILLFTFLPAFATSPAIANGLIFLAGIHVAAFGAGAWISSFASMFWKLVGFSLMFGLSQPVWLVMHPFALTYSCRFPCSQRSSRAWVSC